MSFISVRGVALIVAALPLLIYPGVLIAGVMALGAESGPLRGNVAFKIFIYYSLLYPVVWCLAARAVKSMPPNALATAAVALVPLGILAALAAANDALSEIAGFILAAII